MLHSCLKLNYCQLNEIEDNSNENQIDSSNDELIEDGLNETSTDNIVNSSEEDEV